MTTGNTTYSSHWGINHALRLCNSKWAKFQSISPRRPFCPAIPHFFLWPLIYKYPFRALNGVKVIWLWYQEAFNELLRSLWSPFTTNKKAITVGVIACNDSWQWQTHFCALPQLYQTVHCLDRLRARGLLNVKASRASWNTTPTYQQGETRTWMPNLTGSLPNISEILCITTTWNHQIWGFDDNIRIKLRVFHSLFLKSLAPIHV